MITPTLQTLPTPRSVATQVSMGAMRQQPTVNRFSTATRTISYIMESAYHARAKASGMAQIASKLSWSTQLPQQ
jgi:hypothetical protein